LLIILSLSNIPGSLSLNRVKLAQFGAGLPAVLAGFFSFSQLASLSGKSAEQARQT
jgi:hypothetical protein